MIVEVVIPVLDQTTEEVVMGTWLVKEGDAIRQGEALCEIETDKATVEVESTAEGTVRRIMIEQGATVPPLTVVALVGDAESPLPEIDPFYRTPRAAKPEPVQAAAPPAAAPPPTQTAERFVSPRARRLAAELNVDLSGIRGTGPGGRIVEEDVRAAQSSGQAAPSSTGAGHRQAHTTLVTESWRNIPHFYTSITIDLTSVAARKTTTPGATYTDFMALAIAQALAKHPGLNGHWRNNEAALSPSIHLGIVVQAERGLVIPVLHDLAGHTLETIIDERQRLVESGRTGKLSATALGEATFTLSNMGAGHIDSFTAIINPPQLAILSVGSVMQRPLVVGGELLIRLAATFTVGVDHRAVDGRDSAAFLETLKVALEGE